MQTSALITLVKKKFPDWTSENIREVLNEIQNKLLMSQPLEFMRVYDSSTGKDYKFTTSAGTYEYEVSTGNGFPSNGAFIDRIYESDYNDPETGVVFYPATPSANAKFVFEEDPGATDYYVRYYKKPTEITSTSTALSIPAGYHIDVVFEGVCGMIEQMDNGQSQRWEKFEQVLLPRFWGKANWRPFKANSDWYRGY